MQIIAKYREWGLKVVTNKVLLYSFYTKFFWPLKSTVGGMIQCIKLYAMLNFVKTDNVKFAKNCNKRNCEQFSIFYGTLKHNKM